MELLSRAGCPPAHECGRQPFSPEQVLRIASFSSYMSKHVKCAMLQAFRLRHGFDLMCSHERTPVDEALDSMCRDELLGIIDAHMQQGGSDAKEGFDFDESSAGEDGQAFPTKPR